MLVLVTAFAAPAAALDVVVTIKPIHSLVAAVMGETGTPKLLVDGSASPHTYAMRPSDAKALHGADVFFRVSEGLEPFTAKVVRALPHSVRVVSLAETPGLELLDVRTGATFEGHETTTSTRRRAALVTATSGSIPRTRRRSSGRLPRCSPSTRRSMPVRCAPTLSAPSIASTR